MGSAGVEAGAQTQPRSIEPGDRPRPGLAAALALTLASAAVWGVAHLYMRRRAAGALLLAAWAVVLCLGLVFLRAHSSKNDLVTMAVQPDQMAAFMGSVIALAVVWVGVIVWSYAVVRPRDPGALSVLAGAITVVVLAVAVTSPLGYAAWFSNVANSTLQKIFPSGGHGRKIDAANPFDGRARVNIALLASDNASDRTGTRTDSMTVASIDTHTGDTVLIGLPRNLERAPMPAGPARDRFPNGFTGDGPENPDLLNEVFEYAESHPEIMPGVPARERGPKFTVETISQIIGQPIDYYVLVDMFGFADIIDAMGGVKMRIVDPIPFGEDGGVLQPGDRMLTGKQALWYGRSRNDTDDYVRMGRQKCLLRAVALQADPFKVVAKFDKLATATRRAISTDIPEALVPALIKLSDKAKHGAQISNLSFVPPLIYTGNPNYPLIRRLTADAISPKPSPTATPGGATAAPAPAQPKHSYSPYTGIDTSGTGAQGQSHPVSLGDVCPES